MKKHWTSLITLTVIMIAALCLAASSNQMINYQGRLTDGTGAPIDGTSVSVTFSIYNVASGGTALWTETQSISVSQGLYSVQLGAVNPVPDDLFNAADRWLGVKVGADLEMTPRAQITSVAYAMNSQRIGGQKIQSGKASLSVSGAATGIASVAFPTAFRAPPQVITGALGNQIGGTTFIVEKVENLTASGCDVSFTALDGSTASGIASFDWIAIGE